MTREMLRAKIHRITVTERNVEYEGSLTLDPDLMKACDMLPFERVDVYDIGNGSRFSTYLIEGHPGAGECCVNGAAAHLVEVGDKLILCAYASISEQDVRRHRPRVVMVDAENHIREIKDREEAATRA
jgi:aspartate 1-decarboxylase